MAPSLCVLLFLASVLLAVSAAQSVSSLSKPSFANTTSFTSGTITSSPRLTSSLAINTSCSSCVIAVDAGGLQQIFWFSQSWTATVDTKYVAVTSFNGTNATAVTNTRIVSGNISTLDTSENPYVRSLMMTLDNEVAYFNSKPTLVRGTDGSVGTTSFPYGQAYAEVSAINYRYMIPNQNCPMNMGYGPGGGEDVACQCMMNHWYPLGVPVTGVNSTRYDLDRTYYQPLSSSIIDEHNAGGADNIDSLPDWDGQKFKSWLASDEAFKSAYPNWEDCAFWNTAAGPPAVKLPVAALTATISTTVHLAAQNSSPTPKPAFQPAPPIPQPTNTHPAPASMPSAQPAGQSGSDSGAGSSGSENGGSGSLTSHDGSNPVGEGSQGGGGSSVTSGNTGNTGLGGHTGSQDGEDVGNAANTGSGSDTGSQSHGATGNTGVTGSKGESGSHTNGSGDTANGGISQGGGGSSGGDYGSETQGSKGTGSSDSPGSSAPPAAALPAPIATIGTHIVTASPGASEVYYEGTTLSQNGPHATIDNTDVYLGSFGLVIGGSSTVAIPAAPSSASNSQGKSGAMTFTAAGHTFTSSPSGITVAGTTIQSGSAAVISGTTVSYGPSGLAIGTSTIPIPTPSPSSGVSGAGSIHVFTLGGQTLTANPTAVYIAGTTLTAGGSSITIFGTAISLGSSGIVIASSTYAIPSDALPSSTMVVGSETFTIRPTAIEIDGTTLSGGGSPITMHGTPISLGPFGLVVAGSTVSYRGGPLAAASQSSDGLGGLILAGLGPSSTTAPATGTSTPGVIAFQGAVAKLEFESILILGSLLVSAWVVQNNF